MVLRDNRKAMKNNNEIKRRLDSQRDTETQRERRQKDPAYREAYNQMRREYYARKKRDPKYIAKLKANRRKRDEVKVD